MLLMPLGKKWAENWEAVNAAFKPCNHFKFVIVSNTLPYNRKCYLLNMWCHCLVRQKCLTLFDFENMRRSLFVLRCLPVLAPLEHLSFLTTPTIPLLVLWRVTTICGYMLRHLLKFKLNKGPKFTRFKDNDTFLVCQLNWVILMLS